MFYVDGNKNGFGRYRTKNGVMTRTEYLEDGEKKFSVYHDTSGAPLDTLFHIPSVKKKSLRMCADCHTYFEVELMNNVYHGTAIYRYPNGDTASFGDYFEGDKNGEWRSYYINGSLEYKGVYEHGNKQGEWRHYHRNGELSEIYNYFNGKLHGERKSFNSSGDVTFHANYRHGSYHGEVKYYIDAKNDHTRTYYDGILKSYSYKKNGETITVPVENETVRAEITWDNGTMARVFTLKNGYLQNDYIKYFENGDLYSKVSYKDDWLHGDYETYYSNGNTNEKSKYEYGRLIGTQLLHHSNGELRRKMNFTRGTRFGEATYYDENGNLTETRIYYDGVLIDID